MVVPVVFAAHVPLRARPSAGDPEIAEMGVLLLTPTFVFAPVDVVIGAQDHTTFHSVGDVSTLFSTAVGVAAAANTVTLT